MLLELAIWKSKITEQLERNNKNLTIDMRMQCRIDSVTRLVLSSQIISLSSLMATKTLILIFVVVMATAMTKMMTTTTRRRIPVWRRSNNRTALIWRIGAGANMINTMMTKMTKLKRGARTTMRRT